MKVLDVKLQKDHLDKVCNSRSPLMAIGELLWNSLDADATTISIAFERNQLNGIDRIRVIDNGHGLPYEEAPAAFENLGGSWKRHPARTKTKQRILHGKEGQGRFYAFTLGGTVQWHTTYKENGQAYEYTITGHRNDPTHFTLTEPTKTTASNAGTTVTITNVIAKDITVNNDRARDNLTEQLALYLRKYQDATINYDGTKIDLQAFEARNDEYILDPITAEDGIKIREHPEHHRMDAPRGVRVRGGFSQREAEVVAQVESSLVGI